MILIRKVFKLTVEEFANLTMQISKIPTLNVHATRNRVTGSFQIYQPSVNAIKYSLIQRTVIMWTVLPQEVMQSVMLDVFKVSLSRISKI